MDHTKGLWHVGDKVGRAIYGADDSVVAMCDSMGEAVSDEANARRIVACVNYCAGYDTEGMGRAVSIGRTAKVSLDELVEKALLIELQRDQLLAALEKAVAQLVDSPNGEIIGSYDGDAELISEMQAAIAAVNGKKPTDDRSAIEEFVAVWFEATEEWVAILPNGHVLRGKWGAVGYAVNAALQYLGRGEAEFQLPDGGDGTFYRYVKDEEHWQEGGTPC